jgi:hypothetical protein
MPYPADFHKFASVDSPTVSPLFDSSSILTFNLPELQDSPYKLLGGRLVYF